MPGDPPPGEVNPESERSSSLSADQLKMQAERAQKEKLELDALTEKAKAGDAEAQYKLGIHYCFGEPTEAISWFKLAAGQGVVAAQYDLGMLYMMGRAWNDAPQSYKDAYYWYAVALKSNENDNMVPRGNDHLRVALNTMSKHFSADDRAAIDKRIANWKPSLPSEKTDPISPKWDRHGLSTSHDWDCAVF